jgi:hypothetical protein
MRARERASSGLVAEADPLDLARLAALQRKLKALEAQISRYDVNEG